MPVNVISAFPVIVEDPRLPVKTLPPGKTVGLVLPATTVPKEISNSGSLAATTVNL